MLLLPVEMERVLMSLAVRADGWKQWMPWTSTDDILTRGMQAYALRPADILKRLAAHFQFKWGMVDKDLGATTTNDIDEDADKDYELEYADSRLDCMED